MYLTNIYKINYVDRKIKNHLVYKIKLIFIINKFVFDNFII